MKLVVILAECRILNTRPTSKQHTEYSTCRKVTVRPNNEYLSGQIQSLNILKRLILNLK